MSRLGGAGAVAQLVADIPVSVEVSLKLHLVDKIIVFRDYYGHS